MHPETIAVHAGFDHDPITRAVAVPIYQTVAYSFDSADHGAALFNLEVPGYRYSRVSNPTNAVLEKRVAALEGGLEALSLSSGQAALTYAMLDLAGDGSNIVSVPQLYGTTHTLFSHILPQLGLKVRFAESDNPAAIDALIDENTRGVFCGQYLRYREICQGFSRAWTSSDRRQHGGNPHPKQADRARRRYCGAFAHQIHGGHGTTLGGIIVDSGRFPWKEQAQRFPMFSEPDASYHGMVYTDHFGPAAYIARCRSVFLRTMGSVLPAISAFLILQGVETLALRVERQVHNALKVAEFLRSDPRVAWVNYSGFTDSPSYPLVQKYLGGTASSLMTFGVSGGFEAGTGFFDALKLFKRLANLGDAKSLACHPASTTHRQMPAEAQRKAGVLPETIQLSIGIEHSSDIIADLDQALSVASRVGQA